MQQQWYTRLNNFLALLAAEEGWWLVVGCNYARLLPYCPILTMQPPGTFLGRVFGDDDISDLIQNIIEKTQLCGERLRI